MFHMSRRMSRFDVAMQRAMAAEMRSRVGRMNRTQSWLQKTAEVPTPTWRKYFVDGAIERVVPMDAVRRLAEALEMTAGELTTIAERDAEKYLTDAVGGTDAERADLQASINRRAGRNLPASMEQNPGRSAIGE